MGFLEDIQKSLEDEQRAKELGYVAAVDPKMASAESSLFGKITGMPPVQINQEVASPPKPAPMRTPAKVEAPSVMPEAQAQPSEMNPVVKDYIAKKYDLGNYTDDAREKLLESQSGFDTVGAITGALASLGAGFQGRDSIGAANQVLNQRAARRKDEIDQFDKGREAQIQKVKLDRDEEKYGRDQELLARERDPASPESKMAQALAKEMGFQGDASGITAERFKAFSPVMQKRYEIEQRKLDRQDARAERRALFGIRQEDKQAERDQKREDKELTLAVPGYERTGEVLPKPEEAMKLRKATANADQLLSKLDRLKELVKDKGSFEYGGQGGQEMESLATEIQLLSKGEDMYQLGVLTGPDLQLLQKITADPASMSSLFTRDSTRTKQIDSQIKSIRDKLSAVTKASGYRPKGAPAESAGAQEVERKTKDGRTAIFDANTKQFLRYK